MLLRKNHRHTGMDLRDELIRLACDNRASAQPLPRFGIFPVFPESGKGERASVFHGDRHGFDEFFGNLYHLNAEEEPEDPDYPKNPEFKKHFGPRGVIHSYADGRIEDTGPLTIKRMETVDEEFLAAALDFMDREHKAGKPFFCWFNSTRMHIGPT